MANRIFVFAVVVLWAGSMSWLLVDKVLPSWSDSEPPIPAGFTNGRYVAWSVSWSGTPVGQAATLRRAGPMGTTNLESKVKLSDVPLLDLAPPWMRSVVGDIGKLRFEAYTQMEFDSLDNFNKFESRITVNDVPRVLEMTGQIKEGYLRLEIRGWGTLKYSPKVPAPDKAVFREALFPDSKLPHLYVGRRWSEETYSPFQAPGDPMETITAEVVGVEALQRGEETTRVMRVEFRGESSPGIPEEARLRSVAWVDAADGTVWQQDVHLANSKLRFTRLDDEEAEEVGRRLMTRRPEFGGGRRRHGFGPGKPQSAEDAPALMPPADSSR